MVYISCFSLTCLSGCIIFLVLIYFTVDPELNRHFMRTGSESMYFSFRWLLCLFKREYPLDDVIHLWEVILSHPISVRYSLYVAAATLLRVRNVILMGRFKFEETLKFCNELSGSLNTWLFHISMPSCSLTFVFQDTLDLEEILIMAECTYLYHSRYFTPPQWDFCEWGFPSFLFPNLTLSWITLFIVFFQ